MFKSVWVLGYFRGIRLEIHVSWLIIFALVMVSMTTGLQQQYPHWTTADAAVTALVTVLIFFASILAHELGHSLVAIRRGVPVTAITLFIFGGMAQMSRDPAQANDEFWIAVAGPAVSFALAALFGVLAGVTGGWYEPIPVAFGWLSMINLVVAIFNLIPGFPLDGGRVLRALVWKITGSNQRGNETAIASGRFLAYGLFGLALWNMLVMGNLVGGLWILLIAWFLLTMNHAQSRMYQLRDRMAGVQALDLADPDVPIVPASRPIEEWLREQVLPSGRRAFLVGDVTKVLGLVSLSDTRRIPQEKWSLIPVSDIMTPADKLHHVTPEAKADEILQLMNEYNLNQVPVMAEGRACGWIDRQRLLRMIELHLEVKH
jgi:Zn-dependent protease